MSMFQDIKNGRFYLGDCLEVMKEIPDGVIDLTVTSPPYDDLRTYNGYSFDFENIAKELYRITSEGGVVVWVVADATKNGSETGTSFRQALYFMECGFKLHDTMIWDKMTNARPSSNRYANVFEYMFIFSKNTPKTVNLIKDKRNKRGGKETTVTIRKPNGEMTNSKRVKIAEFGSRNNIWQIPSKMTRSENWHPAPFSEELARDHILSWSKEGDIVFDPFGGSGTTATMAQDLNRKWVTCEISEEYANKAVERILNHTPEVKPEPTIQIDDNIPIPEGEEDGNEAVDKVLSK